MAQCSTSSNGVVLDGTGTTRADGVVRLWLCVSEVPSGSRLDSKSQSELLGCAQKLARLLRDPQIVRLKAQATQKKPKRARTDCWNQLKGAWTVHGVALMCLARVYTLKGVLSQRASVEQQIPHRLLRACSLDKLLQDIKSVLGADSVDTAAKHWEHLESNNRCGALALCLVLSRDQSKLKIAKAVLKDVCNVLAECLSTRQTDQNPLELQSAVQLLLVLSQESSTVAKLVDLGLFSTMCCADGKLRSRLASESKAGGWTATAMELTQRVKLRGSTGSQIPCQHPMSPRLMPNKPPSDSLKLKDISAIASKVSNDEESCDVCARPWTDSYVTWHVTCRTCGVAVHTDCYCPSMEAATVYRWQCERCREGVPQDTRCSLCGVAFGAMKRMHSANSNLWAHVRCTRKVSKS